MGIEITTSKRLCHFKIEGEMTIYTAAEYARTLLDNCDTQKKVELDLEKVTEIDSSGVQLLVALKKQLDRTGDDLKLKNSSEAVQDVLRLTNLATIIDTSNGETCI